MKIPRRNILKALGHLSFLSAAGAVPGLLLAPHRAQAVAAKRNFVMIRVHLGWDVTLSLDPWTHKNGSTQNDMFIEYREDEILSAGGIRLGPACSSILPFASDCAILNGVFMSDSNVSHDANLDYISTGESEGRAGDLPVEIAMANGHGPFGIVFSGSIKRGSRSVMTMTTENMNSIRNSLDLRTLEKYLRQAKSGDLVKAEIALIENADLRQRLVSALEATLDPELKVRPAQPTSFETSHNAAVIAASFLSGSASQAMIDLRSTGLDTHSGHPQTHMAALKRVFDGIGDAFRIFKSTPSGINGASLFDQTTFMVVSEFARTPALDASQGKDHNPLTNSVLLAGAGIKGGQTFGASQLIRRARSKNGEPRHVAGLVNFTSGQIAKTKDEARTGDFQFMYPENVAATAAEILGVDRAKFTPVQANIKAIRNVIKN